MIDGFPSGPSGDLGGHSEGQQESHLQCTEGKTAINTAYLRHLRHMIAPVFHHLHKKVISADPDPDLF
jgi:hypothetical protein